MTDAMKTPAAGEPGHLAEFRRRTPGSQARFEHAQQVTPGGVSHFPRYHVPYPTYIKHARGAHLTDVDGNDYVDLWMAHYDALLGHSPPEVVARVRDVLEDGFHVGLPTDHEIRLAELVSELMPGAEMVRFCCSGSEADMYNVRLARAFTRRSHVLKIEGGFHGANTDLSVDVFGPRFLGAQGAGLLPQLSDYTRSTPFNNIDKAARAIRELKDDLAAVILEPVMGAAGFLPAGADFLAFLREETRRVGALLIFDEVITGFRVAPGGAQELYGITPDLTSMGKVMGGGMPIGAIAGRADVMGISAVTRQAEPEDKVFIGGGTYSCNPISMVAGVATLEIIKRDRDTLYPALEARKQRIVEATQAAFDQAGIPVAMTHVASLFAVHFLKEAGLPIRNAADVHEHTLPARQLELADRLRPKGVFMLHSGAVSAAHGDAEERRIIEAMQACAAEMAAGR